MRVSVSCLACVLFIGLFYEADVPFCSVVHLGAPSPHLSFQPANILSCSSHTLPLITTPPFPPLLPPPCTPLLPPLPSPLPPGWWWDSSSSLDTRQGREEGPITGSSSFRAPAPPSTALQGVHFHLQECTSRSAPPPPRLPTRRCALHPSDTPLLNPAPLGQPGLL